MTPLLTVALVWTLLVAEIPSPGGATCQLDGRFAALVAQLAGQAGGCASALTQAPSGDLVQSTTAGLLVVRQADQRPAFTDGARTWVLGPLGLQERANAQRFAWEADAAGYPRAPAGAQSPRPGAAAGLPPVPDGVAFPGHLLIADRGNRRLLEVTAGGAVTWQYPSPGQPPPAAFGPPDDAFYTANLRRIVTNSEDAQTVTAIAWPTGIIRWQVGAPGQRGAGPQRFSNPDDAVPAADGTVTVADIRNCRLVRLAADGAWLGTRGSGICRHQPPTSFASPNGAFPTADGGLVVTEITGSWVDWLNADGTLRWAVQAPVSYPSDAIPYPDGSVLLTDYRRPGQVVRLGPTGHVRWRYAPTGAAALDHPSIAIPLAANRVAICDDDHSRVLVVDPTTNAVVWQYAGPAGQPLRNPDGLAYRAG